MSYHHYAILPKLSCKQVAMNCQYIKGLCHVLVQYFHQSQKVYIPVSGISNHLPEIMVKLSDSKVT